MRFKKKLFNLYNKTMDKLLSASRFSKSEMAQFRLKVIEFSKEYGIKTATVAFDRSRATIGRCEEVSKRIPG